MRFLTMLAGAGLLCGAAAAAAQTVGQAANQMEGQAASRAVDQVAEQSAEQTEEQSAEQTEDQAADQVAEQSAGQAEDQAEDQAPDQAEDQAPDQTEDQTEDQKTGQAASRTEDQTAGQKAGRAELPALAHAAPGDWRPVGDALLAESRGGFDVGGGLMLSLGIDRVVSLNGNVVSSSSFNIPDASRLSTEQAGQVSAALSSINLIQNGDGNHFAAPALPQALGATVIQNSLNDQVLATRTIINTSVNSLEFFKAIHFQDGLRSALSDAIGAH